MIYSKSQTTVEGLDELIKAFSELPDEALKYVEEASIEPAQKIITKARANLAKYNKYSNTGTLSKSLKVNKPSKKRKYKYEVFSKVWFGAGGAYGVPLELGHRIVVSGKVVGAVKGHPFLRPAADDSKDDVVNIISSAMDEALKKMGGMK